MRLIIIVIILCKFFFLFIGPEPTTWPANNCLQIMVRAWAMSSNCSCVIETRLLRENGRWLRFLKIFFKKQTRWSNEKAIIERSYRKISWFDIVSIVDLLATDEKRCFAQPRPIIVNITLIFPVEFGTVHVMTVNLVFQCKTEDYVCHLFFFNQYFYLPVNWFYLFN